MTISNEQVILNPNRPKGHRELQALPLGCSLRTVNQTWIMGYPVTSGMLGPGDEPAGRLQALLETEDEVTEPPMYRVLLMNDDFTPMEFVIVVLMKFFAKSEAVATTLMLEVHQKGRSVVGVYSKEIAETKTHLVNTYARQHEFPLLCQYEKD
jgi:ATP-dependent Clp protease adaptor protein ClpS